MAAQDDTRDPSLTNLLDLHAEVVLDRLNVMLPGKIVSYDATKQTAIVQLLAKKPRVQEDGSTVAEDIAPISCPVEFVGPARGRITWPVAAGDLCEVRFASTSLARLASMPAGQVVDPGDTRRGDLADGVAFVGFHVPSNPPTDAPTDAVVVHVSGGVKVKLGSSGASKKALTTDDGAAFRTALAYAILQVAGDLPAVHALTALYNALSNGASPPSPSNPSATWPAGSSKVLLDT